MGRPKKTVNEIIRGKAGITPETALELELVTGVPADFWNARERDYRAHLAQAAQTERLAKQIRWARAFPISELAKRGWIQKPDSNPASVKSLLEFFGVASSDQWWELHQEHQVAFRKSATFESDPYGLSAWLRIGALKTKELECAPYDRRLFLQALHESSCIDERGSGDLGTCEH
jgi:plasmid maintenance system antidote protein VapI